MDTRERILQGATDLFKKNGIKSVTMDDIAKSLGMSKRTIYENFIDKKELIEAILKMTLEQSLVYHIDILDKADNIYMALYQFSIVQRQIISSTNPQVFVDLRKYYKDTMSELEETVKSHTIQICKGILKKGIDDGMFCDQIDIELTSQLLFEFSILACTIADDGKYEYRDILMALFNPYLRGISTRKGFEYMNNYKQE